MVLALTSQETITRARKELDSGRSATVSELLRLIESLSVNVDVVSLDQLTDLVEKDALVLTRILRMANKLAHNPGIAPIETLTQAIHQIGFNRVRNIATSLLLLDKAGTCALPEQREAAALTLGAGLIAKGAAKHVCTHDPESVFACTALRNIGRILMGVVSPSHYQEALVLNRNEPQFDGFRRRFGVSVTELSRTLLAGTKLPEEMIKALRDGEPESFRGTSTTQSARLFAFCDYGLRLATLVMAPHEPDEGFIRKVTQLSRRFEKLIPGADEIAVPALLYANANLRHFERCAGHSQLPSDKLSRIRQRLELIAPGAALEAEKAEILPIKHTLLAATKADSQIQNSPAQSSTAPATPGQSPSEEPPTLSTSAATAAASSEGPQTHEWDPELLSSLGITPAPEQPAPVVFDSGNLSLVRGVLEADEAWLIVQSPASTAYRIAEGQGPNGGRLARDITVNPTERSIFGLCITRREVVLVHDSADPGIQNYLPDWWVNNMGSVQSFALVPVKDALGHVDAILFLGWKTARRVTLSQAHLGLVQQLFSMKQAA